MYHHGKGVPQNDMQAYAWFSTAAAQGNSTAKKNKEILSKRMTSSQIAEAQNLSGGLWEKYVIPFQK